MATITTRAGKGSPLTNNEVDANFTNLNTEVTDATTSITSLENDKVEASGDSMTGNLSFGDNNKVILGAGSDLQIYHDGSNSYVQDSGTGDLWLAGTQVRIANATGTKTNLYSVNGGQVSVRYNGTEKLATTSTGIDVTGDVAVSGAGTRRIDISNTSLTDTGEMVTLQWDANADLTFQGRASDGTFKGNWYRIEADASDGLADAHRFYTDSSVERMNITSTGIDVTGTVTADDLSAQSNTPTVNLVSPNGSNGYRFFSNVSDSVDGGIYLQDVSASNANRLLVSHLGDISFYNDAGTSQDLFWDASTSRLGLGTTSPSTTLDVAGSATITTADNTSQLTLASTDADATVGPRFDLWRNSGSPAANDNTGQIRFLGEDSTGAQTSYSFINSFIVDPTDGAESGKLVIETRINSANRERITLNTDAMVVNEDGRDIDFRVESGTNTHALFVDAGNNRVGILNSSPATALDVTGTVTADGLTLDGQVSQSGVAPAYTMIQTDTTDLNTRFQVNGQSLTFFTMNDALSTQTARLRINNSSGDINFYNDAGTSQDLYWDASTSRLGLGLTSPAYQLDVQGSGAGIRVDNTAGAPNQTLMIFQADLGTNDRNMQIKSPATDSASDPFRFTTANSFAFEIDSNASAFVIDSAARVGIGIANPSYELVVSNGGASGIEFGPAYSGTANLVQHYNRSGAAYVDSVNIAAQHRFAIGGTEAMRIDSSGNLLVGTLGTTPHTTTSSANAGFALTSGGMLRLGRNSNPALNVNRITDDGLLAMWYRNGTNVGNISVTSTTTTYNTSSDQRLKDNIVDAPSASDDIDAIQVRSFDWKADGSHQKYGMVAQELQGVAPEAVSEGDTEQDMMGVDYSKLVPMLVKEIQSLRARVAQLEGAN